MDDRKTTAVCFRPPHVVYTQTHTHTDTHTWEHHQQQQALSAFKLKFNSERQRRVSWVMSSQRHTKQFDVIGAKLTFPLFFFLFDLSSVNPRSKTHTRTQYVYTQNKTTTVDCSNSQHSVCVCVCVWSAHRARAIIKRIAKPSYLQCCQTTWSWAMQYSVLMLSSNKRQI